MPLHDWTRVPDYAFDDFRLGWLLHLGTAANAGGLVAAGYGSRVEPNPAGELGRRLVVRRDQDARVVALAELVSPGNKSSAKRFAAFVDTVVRAVEDGVHLLVIDPFPPGPRDPAGVHGAIWRRLAGRRYVPPADKPLTLAAYEAGGDRPRCYVEPTAAGDRLIDMPLFLVPGRYVNVPLEASYQTALGHLLPQDRALLEG